MFYFGFRAYLSQYYAQILIPKPNFVLKRDLLHKFCFLFANYYEHFCYSGVL